MPTAPSPGSAALSDILRGPTGVPKPVVHLVTNSPFLAMLAAIAVATAERTKVRSLVFLLPPSSISIAEWRPKTASSSTPEGLACG
eukprot:275229-Alexandrium_andersonii.AAC.1